jgi:hypothetical protein
MRRFWFFAVMLSAVSTPVNADSFLYVDPFDSHLVIEVDTDRSVVILNGHLAYPAQFCNEEASMECFSSPTLSFSVPRPFEAAKDTWEFTGQRYRLIDRRKISLFGVPHTVNVIEAADGNLVSQYLFSEQRGLIAIRTSSDERSVVVLIWQRCGFGAPKGCN